MRPIGSKVMTFHLDVADAGGRPSRVTFSTIYSAPPPTTPRGGGGGNGRGVTDPSAATNGGGAHPCGRVPTLGGKHFNASGTAAASAVVTWKGGFGGGGGGGHGGGTGKESAALSRRGGALRIPVSFDVSRSRGWAVIAVDMVNLMREGSGCDGVEEEAVGGGVGADAGAGTEVGRGKGYGVLRSVRLGSNMVVRGVYASDCVYSPQTLPKDMAFRSLGGGDWDSAYKWMWLPEVRGEGVGRWVGE